MALTDNSVDSTKIISITTDGLLCTQYRKGQRINVSHWHLTPQTCPLSCFDPETQKLWNAGEVFRFFSGSYHVEATVSAAHRMLAADCLVLDI